MADAGGYILLVPTDRRHVLLSEYTAGRYENPRIVEPVPTFAHSRRAPLVVFASFGDGHLTHIANGRRGISAGTGLSRLTMIDLVELAQPISFQTLLAKVATKFRHHLERALTHGGLLPKKTLGAFVDVLLAEDASLGTHLARYSTRRTEQLRALSPTARENLALQKETLTLAMQIAGVSTEPLLGWTLRDGDPSALFLDGLTEVRTPEDAMLISDLSVVPGFEIIREYQFAAKTFQSERDRHSKLTVIMANRFALEEQTGADLIYYNERYKSFVLVQYKAMEKPAERHEFRWAPGDQLAIEISRMDDTLAELAKLTNTGDPDSFRLHENPFFLKICPRFNFNPDDRGLFQGMYFPLAYWKLMAEHSSTLGPKGGRFIAYENAGRRMNNSDFIAVVAGAWVGTTVPQSAALDPVIKKVLQTNKTLTFAIKRHDPDPDDGGIGVEHDLFELEDDEPLEPLIA